MSQSKAMTVGIMQGRLSQPVNGQIQAFPATTWRDEFRIAREIGFDAMEIIFDGPDNPLFNEGTLQEIRALADRHQIHMSSVCSDYTMHHPLFGSSQSQSTRIVQKLIEHCAAIHIPRVGISFEDNSALLNDVAREQAIESVQACVRTAEQHRVIITMETSLSVMNVREFLRRVNSPCLKINFDFGNSCSLGEDTAQAIRDLAPHIGGIHIKDRTRLFGKTVPLGQGDVDFKSCFQALKDIAYDGVLIIQGARQENDLAAANNYLQFVRSFL